MSRIHTDKNGLAVNAITALEDGTDVKGVLYQVTHAGGCTDIEFHKGPIDDGLKGVTSEALLAILEDRLTQVAHVTKDQETSIVVSYIETARMILDARTFRREVAGVAGTSARISHD